MTKWNRFLTMAACGLLLAGTAAADTLELKDGRVLKGRYLGGTRAVLRFEVDGSVQTFSTNDIVAVTFTNETRNAPADQQAPPPQDQQATPDYQQQAPPPTTAATVQPPQIAPQPVPALSNVTLPAGQSLLIRMIDGVDSSKNQVGDVFKASLETDLVVGNTLVARKGTDVYGRLSNAQEAGHLSGSSELQLELTRMVIDGKDYPLVSSDYTLRGKGRGGDTAKKVGGGAIAGAIIGAIAGGGKGAAIGAGVGSAAGAGVQIFTRGQQVKVPSETLLEFRLQQAATVQVRS